MLKQRVITAIVLLLILLPALFYPSPWPFCAVALVLIAAGAWEWALLNGYSGAMPYLAGFVCFALCSAAWWAGMLSAPFPYPGLWIFVGALWVLFGAFLLRGGSQLWTRMARPMRLAIGLWVLGAAWLAVAQARVIGINFLMSILAMVWMADIAAYFSGKTFGGQFARGKLAPAISPGKSWEGVWGGMTGVVVMAFAWRAVDSAQSVTVPSLYTHLYDRGWWWLLTAVIFLTAMSVVGDLAESLIKRSAGVKDSSGLLPGHGGVLDRVDALLPTLPLAMMLYYLG